MKKMLWLICLLVFATAASSAYVWAEEQKEDTKEAVPKLDKKKKAEIAKKADMFLQVVSYGEAAQDPMVMLGAVKIFDGLPFKSIEKPAAKGQKAVVYDRDGLLKQAKEFAAGDTELLTVIAKIQDAPEKTEVRGHHIGGYYGGHAYYERPHHERVYERYNYRRRW